MTQCNTLQHRQAALDVQLNLTVLMKKSCLDMWHDQFTCVTRLTSTCDMTNSHVWHGSLARVTWLSYACYLTHSYARHVTFTCVTCLTDMCDMYHLHVWHVSITCVTYYLGGATKKKKLPGHIEVAQYKQRRFKKKNWDYFLIFLRLFSNFRWNKEGSGSNQWD